MGQTNYYGHWDSDCDFNPADYAEPTFYNEFTGEHYPLRRAGDRYTGLPRGTDPMFKMQAARKHYLAEKAAPPYRGDFRRPSVSDCKYGYEHVRLIVMRPSSRRALKDAEMRALAARCVTRTDELSARIHMVMDELHDSMKHGRV